MVWSATTRFGSGTLVNESFKNGLEVDMGMENGNSVYSKVCRAKCKSVRERKKPSRKPRHRRSGRSSYAILTPKLQISIKCFDEIRPRKGALSVCPCAREHDNSKRQVLDNLNLPYGFITKIVDLYNILDEIRLKIVCPSMFRLQCD
ncbi:hypothetical protein AVEN_56282-1 [Araneus ventricosus]|uniref:Uncharacterized protein n=1 Tax=Araneus ventricosus TaxID=182803 RepID=A0A4Y2RXR9_ARAVE|nr:hypothetical protein AVEN_56282-1 [Araneus ventricosus]